MKFAIIEKGVVKNIVEASQDFGASQGWEPVEHEDCVKGATVSDGVYTKPVKAAKVEKTLTKAEILKEIDKLKKEAEKL